MKIDKRELKRLAAEGMTQRQLARHFGVCRGAVSSCCTRNGIKTKGNEFPCRSRRGRAAARKSIAFLKVRGRVRAALLGWPQATTGTQAALLSALLRRPMTLAEAFGRVPNKNHYRSANALHARGLILGTRVGARLVQWRLAPGVKPGSREGGAIHTRKEKRLA